MAMERELVLRTETTFFDRKADCDVKDNADAVKAAKSRPTKDFIIMSDTGRNLLGGGGKLTSKKDNNNSSFVR